MLGESLSEALMAKFPFHDNGKREEGMHVLFGETGPGKLFTLSNRIRRSFMKRGVDERVDLNPHDFVNRQSNGLVCHRDGSELCGRVTLYKTEYPKQADD